MEGEFEAQCLLLMPGKSNILEKTLYCEASWAPTINLFDVHEMDHREGIPANERARDKGYAAAMTTTGY